MTVKVAVVRFSNINTTGTQDITTTDLGGLTPKAAIFLSSDTVTDGTVVSVAMLNVGLTDGTSENASTITLRHNVATMETAHRAATDEVIQMLGSGAGTAIFAEARFSAFITNGVRINWNDSTGNTYIHTVILFAGDDLSVKVGTVEVAGPDTTETTVTTTFQPDDVFFVGSGNAWDDVMRSGAQVQLGVAHRGASTITQASIAHNHPNALADAAPEGIIQDDRIAANLSSGLSREFELSAFLSNGFKIKHRAGASTANQWLAYLALSYGGKASSYVGTDTSKTSTGTKANTAPGFEPQFVLLMPTFMPALNTIYSDGNVASYGVSAITSTQQHALSIADEDAAATSDTQALLDDVALHLWNPNGNNAELVATRNSLDSNGYTLNYTTANATARQMVVWAISTVVTSVDLTATGVATGAPTLGTPTAGRIHNLSATGIATGAPTVGSAAIGQKHSLSATGVATGTPTLATPSVGQKHALGAVGVATGAPSLGSAAIGQTHGLTATGITATPTLGPPVIGQNYILATDGIATGSPAVGIPTVGQAHGLSAADGVTGAPTLGNPFAGQDHALSAADGVTGAPSLGEPLISTDGTDNLSADDLMTGAPTLGDPFVGQIHGLSAAGIATGAPTLGTPTAGRIHNLTADDAVFPPSLGTPTLGSIGTDELGATGIATGAPTLGVPFLAQRHALGAVGITTGAPALGEPLMGGRVYPPDSTYIIPFQDRVYVIQYENRTYEV